MKYIMLGNEREEKKFKVDIIDLINDQGKFFFERVFVDEFQNVILFGMLVFRLLSIYSLKYLVILIMFFFFFVLQGEVVFLLSMFNNYQIC